MPERLAVLLQYLLPKRALTVLMGRLAGARAGAGTHMVVRRFIARYGVDMTEAADPRVESYASFNDFFTRELRAGARPLAPVAESPWVCPVDGAVSQCGAITGAAGDEIFQAKGHSYTTRALLGGDADRAAVYAGGEFATLYLSPRDYHRIHMPCDGTLRSMTHVPGDLFSVNPATARGVPGLFARNERVVCEFDTPHGPMALVLVGATIVGSMATVWHGVVNPPRPGVPRHWRYGPGGDASAVFLARGQEMGRFLLGSTVVLLFPRGVLRWRDDWTAGRAVRMGEAMAVPARP